MYLTIKDEQTRISAVMFAGNNRSLKFTPENGMNVLIRGEISVFEAYGQYQLYIQQMEPDGIGALYLAFEQLKEKLHKLGYFDPVYKKEIPLFPKHIGVITSPTGAAVRDIITTIKRRYPIVKVTIIPVLVQGPNAAASIKNAIETANRTNLFDVLITGRGGGSIEELWSFNEEIVAKAIFESEIPVISAVGHETDMTISDYVADLRAPTPTSAAEMAVPSQTDLKERIFTLDRSLDREMNRQIADHKKQLNRLEQSYAFRYPEQLLKQKEQELDRYVETIQKAAIHHIKQEKAAFSNLYSRLSSQHPKKQMEQYQKSLVQLMKQHTQNMNQILDKKKHQIITTIEKLTLLNPLEVMKRGFAIPFSYQGEVIKSVRQVNEKDTIKVNLQDGILNCEIIDVEGKNDE